MLSGCMAGTYVHDDHVELLIESIAVGQNTKQDSGKSDSERSSDLR